MNQQCLEIIRLTQTGDIIKSVKCRSGRVSVLRSHDEKLLDMYIKAIGGQAIDARFTLLLNDMQFRLPREQGLLEYDRSPELANEEYRGVHEYPEHAPKTRQHHEVYNFLRKNNFGGGI